MTDTINTREIVLDMLTEVIEGNKFSHTVLKSTLRNYQHLTKQDRAFIARLFIGTVKRYLTLDYIVNSFSTSPIQQTTPQIRNILRMGVYQIIYMDQVQDFAACNEAVKLTRSRGFTRLTGFVNGVLRNVSRNASTISFPDKQEEPKNYLRVAYSAPEWLVKKLMRQYDFDTVEQILAASLKEKEVTIRCNNKKLEPSELKKILIEEGMTVEDNEILPYAYHIKDFDYLEKLESFKKGLFTVQDVSSMLVCEAAGISGEDFVVDVCAAPGGKTLHAAEKAKCVSARDISEHKISLITENLRRMGFDNVKLKVWDATQPDEEITEQADVVLADLPCSGLGVIGKKPDIKYKLTQKQHKELIELQKQILNRAQKYVKKGGVLIYSTCTITKEENQDNRKWFLKHFDFEAESLDPFLPVQLRDEATREGYLQLLQGFHRTDGFFLARFRRRNGNG